MNRLTLKLFLTIAAIIVAGTVVSFGQQSSSNSSPPRFLGWSDDNNYLIQVTENDSDVVRSVDVRRGREVELPDYKTDRQELAELLSGYTPSSDDIISDDNRSIISVRNGDLYYRSASVKGELRLTNDGLPRLNIRFSPNAKRIAYTKERDLYVYDLEGKQEIRLTYDAAEKIYNGYASWVYYEEILGRASRYAAFWWSPDGSRIAFLRFDDNPVPDFTLVRLDEEDGVNGTTEVTPYPKPGDANPVVRMGIAEVSSADITWVKTDRDADNYIAWPFWTPDSKYLAVQVLNRDQNDLKIILSDVTTGDYTEIYQETTDTWVDFFKDTYVMNDGSGFILRSHKSGWENLYYYNWDGILKAQLTDYDFRVRSIVRVDEQAGQIYFTANGEESTDLHLYKTGLDGRGQMQITQGDGTHRVSISPGGSYYADTWSSINDPGGIVLLDKRGNEIRYIYRAEKVSYDPLRHSRSQMVRIETGDGLFDMPAIITYPVNFNENSKYPVVFTIYGGPDAGRVRNSYVNPSPDWYAQNGIITISVDHRGSGHFGRRGLDYMHRSLGKWEILDYADAVKWLREKPYVDHDRMGITGGSYGGYMTCLALTKGEDYWTHGVARAPVSDWKLYDTVYTERYMDEPDDNSDGYRDGSVLSFIKKYRGKLQIVHGDMDDNVHMQNSIQMISKLQDEGKEFEFMIYPGGRHSWGGAKREHSNSMADKFWLREFFGR